MKRGKKYVDTLKKFDKTVQYDTADAIKLVKENATAKFDETIEVHIGQDVTDVMPSSRSVAQLYCRTVQVRL